MIGAITSGPIADFIGRKGVSKQTAIMVILLGTCLLNENLQN
jgi:hypothetical protein